MADVMVGGMVMVEGVHRHYLNIGDMPPGLPLLFHPVFLLASGTLPERVA